MGFVHSRGAALLSRAIGGATLAAGLLLAPAITQAALVNWDIDETQSSLTLNMPDQGVTLDGTAATIRLRNANNSAWTQGRTAAVDGTIATQYTDGSSIQFLTGQHNAFGLPSGSFRPNPAQFNPASTNAENPNGQFTGTGTAPAVYAAKVRASVSILTVDAAFISFLDMSYDLASTALAITGTSFGSNALTMGVQSSTVALDGLSVVLIGQPIPDTPGTIFSGITGLNSNAGGQITSPDPINQPNLRRLVIPVSVPLVLSVEGINLNASVTGSIVAFATLPEPTTLLLLGTGVAGLMIHGRRRRS